jgi:nucleoside-diphosphate-sugar epimerase
MQSIKIMVSGANGFIGASLCARLERDHKAVISVGSSGPTNHRLSINKRFNELCEEDAPTFDVLVHLAALNNTLHAMPQDFLNVNVEDALRLFKLAAGKGCRAIIYASSVHVYGCVSAPMAVERSYPNPVSAYGRSKLELERKAELFSRATSIPCVGLRLSNVYGPGEAHKGPMASQVTQLARQMVEGDPTIYSDGSQVRDFIFIDDVVEAYVKAIDFALTTGNSGLFNCGSGDAISFNALVQALNKIMGLRRTPRYTPEPERYLRNVSVDIATTSAALKWNPRSLRQGLADYKELGQLGFGARISC